MILYAEYVFVYEDADPNMQTQLLNIPHIEIYFNERLYNLFVGLPHTYMTKHGDLNYKLKVVVSRSNLVPKKYNGHHRNYCRRNQSVCNYNKKQKQRWINKKYLVLLCGTL